MLILEQTPPKGYLTLDQAVSRSGYNPKYLIQLARKGHIERIEQQGISYFSARSLDNYIQPSGYLTVEGVARITGLSLRYLRKLAGEKRIRSIREHRRIFLLSGDVKKLIVPGDFVSSEEAAEESGYVADYLKLLARQGFVRKVVIRETSLPLIRRY